MSGPNTITNQLREHKTLLIVITIGIVLLEVEIFAFAAMKTGRMSSLHIKDNQGNLIHVTDGDNLSTFNKYYFENTFGPLEQYQVHLVTQERPFPFRAWFAAAIGIPIGALLLFAFMIRAYLAIVHDQVKPEASVQFERTDDQSNNRFNNYTSRIPRVNIFIFGAVVFVMALSYWIIPNSIAYLGKAGLGFLVRYKEVFLLLAGMLVVIIMWIIYLRYLLAKKSIASQTEIQKYRLRLEMNARHLLPSSSETSASGSQQTTDAAFKNSFGNTINREKDSPKA